MRPSARPNTRRGIATAGALVVGGALCCVVWLEAGVAVAHLMRGR